MTALIGPVGWLGIAALIVAVVGGLAVGVHRVARDPAHANHDYDAALLLLQCVAMAGVLALVVDAGGAATAVPDPGIAIHLPGATPLPTLIGIGPFGSG
jgi:hypothetical protein